MAISAVALGGETVSNATRQDMLTAMKAEAFAYAKYKLYSEQARKNGNEALAALFERTAADEFDKHFKEQAKYIGLVKSDHMNLVDAMSGEYVEYTQMYLDMAKRAEAAGDASSARYFTEIAADESNHRDAFKAALATPSRGKD
jgi:rubrerythrin